MNPPAEVASQFSLMGRANAPFFLQYYPLYAGVQPYAAPAPDGPAPAAGAPACPVAVMVNGVPIEPAAIGWCNLSDWAVPTTSGVNVAVDPVLGRLVFATPPAEGDLVSVSYTYAFSGDYGGGFYDYPVPAADAPQESALPVTLVPAFATYAASGDLSTASNEVVEIQDSGIWVGDLALEPGANLLVIRATDTERPVMTGDLTVTAVAGSELTLRGLGIGGSLTIAGERLAVRLEHCTVRGGVDWSTTAVEGTLVLDHSLCGALQTNPAVDVTIGDSAVDSGSDTAAAVSGGAGTAAGSITITTSTLIGTVNARTVPLLSDSIVTGTVISAQRQAGCLRYSFVPLTGSQTSRRFRCQPDLEVSTEVAAALAANPGLTQAEQALLQAAVEAWLAPAFTSRTPGRPGYLQLADATPDQVSQGAEDGDEMGVFYGLYSGRRESNLSYRLNEYLRIGLQAGVIHAT